MVFKNPVSSSQNTLSSPSTKTRPLILLREAIALLLRDKQDLLKHIPKIKSRDLNCKSQVIANKVHTIILAIRNKTNEQIGALRVEQFFVISRGHRALL